MSNTIAGKPTSLARRRALWRLALLGGTTIAPAGLFGVSAAPQPGGAGSYRELLPPDANGVRLLPGFTSRVIARSGQQVPGTSYRWHDAPDGGATFSLDSGGWIYCCNSERGNGQGGVGALRFSASGDVVAAYSILSGTNRNCAGGATPWNTWLSCEETSTGTVWECDPLGVAEAVEHRAMGSYAHEAVAVDPVERTLYLTEDRTDGRLYRFTPSDYPDLAAGLLEVARVDSGQVSWLPVPNPNPASGQTPTRQQVPQSTSFNGGEGIVYQDNSVFFVTKGDNRVWQLNLNQQTLVVIYDDDTHPTPSLSGVDNVTTIGQGNLLVAEDGGDLELVVLTSTNEVFALAQLPQHSSSEITGPAFSPDGSRLYFNSQRGTSGSSSDGVTFEVSGPFDRIRDGIMFRDGFEG